MDLQEIIDCAIKVDISDPSCMDKLLIYLETLQEEDEEFMQLLTDKCMNEEISWDQPWYQKGRSVTRPLKEQFEDESDTYRKDTISKKENEIIEKNWRKFRKKFNMPDKLVCFARWKNLNKSRTTKSPVERARLYLTAFLARGLKRTLFQVYRHVLTFYGCPNKRTYQPFELKLMEICFEHYPTRAVTWLSKILGREPRGLYKQLQVKYNGKIEKKKLKWTLPLATKFVQLLLKYTELPLKKLKNTKIDKHVWQNMEIEMDQHYVYLKQFWYDKLHVQLFVKSDVKFNRLKKRVYKILRDSKYQVWTDIRWKDVLSHFPDGFTHRFLYKITNSICRHIKNYLTAPLQDVVNYGLKRSKLIRYHNRRLKTLKLNKDGNLEYVNYSKSEI